MRWIGVFRRRRRTAAGEAHGSEHRPGGWGQTAFPPVLATGVPPSREVPPPKVRLSFDDGTSVEIDDRSQASEGLQAAASRLLSAAD
jgi:hypothetical protein